MKRGVTAALAAAAAGLVLFVAPADAANGQVHAASNTFNDGGSCSTSPGEDTAISAGGTVTWHNCDSVLHTVTSDTGVFNQQLPPGGQDVVIAFDEPGIYPYHCTIHGMGMKGTITVAGEAPATTQPTVPATTATTAKAATTTSVTSSTVPRSTTSTTAFGGDFFSDEATSSTTSTTGDPTVTTRALGSGGDGGTSAGAVGLLVVGLGAVGTAGALLIRRMRAG